MYKSIPSSLQSQGRHRRTVPGSTDGQTHRRPRTQICWLCAHGLLALSCVTSPPWPCAGSSGATGVLGYSLGASFAAAMAAVSGTAETGPPMETVVLVEPVAVQRWSAAVLLSAVRRENRLVGAHLEETATVAGAVPPLEARPDAAPNTRRRVDLLLLANALRAGCLSDDLRAATRRPAPRASRLVVVRAE